MKSITNVAIAAALLISSATFATAQTGPGTAGGANAGAASNNLGGGGTPTQPGTGPGTTNPGNTNVAPAEGPPPPTASLNEVTSSGTIRWTMPLGEPSTVGCSGTVGRSTR